MRFYSVLLVTVVLTFTGYPPVIGQPSQPLETSTPTYRSTTHAVVVDVVVSKGDEPILGLHRQDFHVFEDGKEQVVDYFEEHTSRSLPSGATQPLPKMPAGVYTNVPPAPESDSVNVLLLDSLNTETQDQSYVRNQMIKFLKKIQPGTRVAIFALGSRLRMIQGFTSDASLLNAALTNKKDGFSPEKDASSRSRSDEWDEKESVRTMIMEIGGRDAGVDSLEASQAEHAERQVADRIAITFEALSNIARYLAAIPGRKNLLWFAGSYPVSVFPSEAEKRANAKLHGYLDSVKRTADLLTSSDVAVYPINAQGMMNVHAEEVQNYLNPGIEVYAAESAQRADVMLSMERLATETGGKAFFNTNDLNSATQKAIADGAHFYTLVYTPTNKRLDGSYRRIEVKVADSKCRVAFRHGYYADTGYLVSAQKAEPNPLHALMMRGMPNSTQVLYAARVVPSDPQPPANASRAGRNPKFKGPAIRYSIDFMIRWTDVKLDATADGLHAGKIDVELLAYDKEGNALNWTGATQVMNIKPDIFAAIQRSGIPAHVEIDLPSDKDVYLETGVYDLGSGKAGTMEVPLLLSKQKLAAIPQATHPK